MHFLCHSAELAEGRSLGFECAGQPLLALRYQGQARVYRNRCPHRQLALNWRPDDFLDASASLIRCAHHGALFLPDTGECVAGPCAGQSLQALPCTETTQGLFVQLD